MSSLESLIEVLGPLHEQSKEIKHLQEIERWALDQQPVRVGDKAVLRKTPVIRKSSGWWSYREFIVTGCTGKIVDMSYSVTRKSWTVLFRPDVQWSSSDGIFGRRICERPVSFYFDISWVRPRKKKDKKLKLPEDTKRWREK